MYIVKLLLTSGNFEFIVDKIEDLEPIINAHKDEYMGCEIKRIEPDIETKVR